MLQSTVGIFRLLVITRNFDTGYACYPIQKSVSSLQHVAEVCITIARYV